MKRSLTHSLTYITRAIGDQPATASSILHTFIATHLSSTHFPQPCSRVHRFMHRRQRGWHEACDVTPFPGSALPASPVGLFIETRGRFAERWKFPRAVAIAG